VIPITGCGINVKSLLFSSLSIFISHFLAKTMLKLLERPKELDAVDSDAAKLEDLYQNSAGPVDDRKFHTLNDADIQRLNDLFYRTQCAASRAAVPGAALAIAGAVVSAGVAGAAPPGGGDASEEAAESIAAGVANAIAMIRAIDGIGLAAFGVALAPMGFMVTLRVLNMVLSRV
jgi:hypothetical protein